MTDDKGRLSLKISGRARTRWEYYAHDDERHSETMNRLLDDAKVPDPKECDRCGGVVNWYIYYGDEFHYLEFDGEQVCVDCVEAADIDPEDLVKG